MAGIAGSGGRSGNHRVLAGLQRRPPDDHADGVRLADGPVAQRARRTCSSTSCCTWERWRRFCSTIGTRSGKVRGDCCWTRLTCRRASTEQSVVRVGLLAAVATSPLVPFALFFKKPLEEMFQSSQAAGVGFLITAAVLLLVSYRLQGPGRRKRACADDLARCPLDRHRADVRPLARREPERLDDRRGARAGLLADLVGRLQPADRRPGHLRCGGLRAQGRDQGSSRPGAHSRSHRPNAGRHGRCRPGRLSCHSLADQGCSSRPAMVFFCILDCTRSVGAGALFDVRRFARWRRSEGFGPDRRARRFAIGSSTSWGRRRVACGSCRHPWLATS